MIPKDYPFTYEDILPGVTATQDLQGNLLLKEVQFQVVEEEDAGLNAEDRDQSTRQGQGRLQFPAWTPDRDAKVKMKMRRKLLSFVLYIVVSFRTE